MSDLTWIRRWPDTCHAEVTRRGELAPCDKPAVAARQDPGDDRPWPVCVHHCRRGFMVPLRDLLAETRRDS